MRNPIHRHDSKQVRQAKRSFNDKQRRKEKSKIKIRLQQQTRSLLEAMEHDIKQSPAIEKFCQLNNLDRWGKSTSQYLHLKSSYTLFDNPDQVLKILLNMFCRAKFYAKMPIVKVEGRASFGALYLIDNMCWEIGTKRRWSVHFEIDSQDEAMLSKIHANKEMEYEEGTAYLINEKVRINRSHDALDPQPFSVKARDITEMVKKGMRAHTSPDFELSPEQHQAIFSTIGEQFDNIKSHVPKADHGYLCGFYNPENKTVTILVFNFGQTISETLDTNNLPNHVQHEVNSVLDNHTKNRYFKTSFSRSNALTLLAIQEGISSKLNADRSRGHGLIDYIANCFSLSPKCKISIISGDTCIKIDDKYRIGNKFFIDRERRIIAFNDTNDIYSTPDPRYVKKLNAVFNGVIIETIIPLC